MEMDSKLQLSDLRSKDETGNTRHLIKLEDVDSDDASEPQQKLLLTSSVGEPSNTDIEVQKSVIDTSSDNNHTDFAPSQNPAISELYEEDNVCGTMEMTIGTNELTEDEKDMIAIKPDPPLNNVDENLNTSTCSINIVDGTIDAITQIDRIPTLIDDKAAPDPPEFSNVLFDADSSIVRFHHSVEMNDVEEKAPTVKKEVDPPEYSAVIFDADASIVRLHYEEDRELAENREPDPPECTTLPYNCDNDTTEKETEVQMIEENEIDTATTDMVESEFISDLPELTFPAVHDEDAYRSNLKLICNMEVATATTQMEAANPEQICLNVVDASNVEVATATTQMEETNPEPICVNVVDADVEHQLQSTTTDDIKSMEDTIIPPSKQNEPSLSGSTAQKSTSVEYGSSQLESATIELPVGLGNSMETPSCDNQNATSDTKETEVGYNSVPTPIPSDIASTGAVAIVSECPFSQHDLQSSFAEMNIYDDDCSYEEIIVDDDDEFIEYVDEILEDDFTEVTCDSENGVETSFIVSSSTGFNGNVSRSSNMDEHGYKRPVIKSATQKALEKEVAVKTAEAEEVMENVRFQLARQNSFCRKDDEYRKQLEMEELEHLRQEEEEERKRAVEVERQSRLNAEKAKACIAQQEEEEMRQRLYNEEIRRQQIEAEAHRIAAEEAAREKAATEKHRRDAEEREIMERDVKRKAMEEEVRLLQAKLAEAKIAAESAKKKQMDEKMRLKAKVDAHRREKRRTSITDTAQAAVEVASAMAIEPSTVSKTEVLASVTESAPPSAAPVNNTAVYYPLDALRQQSIPGLDYKNREIYIHPDEFQKLFQMSIAEFNEQPKWKRTNLKRKLKLF